MAPTIETTRRQFFKEAQIDKVSWGAIIAGAVCALALQIVFSLMAAGLGLSMVQDNGAGEAGSGAGIMFAITAVISLIVGGAIAGRMSGSHHTAAATLHGIVVWALVMLGVTWMGVSATSAIVRGATSAATATGGAVANLAGSAGQAVGDLAGSLAPNLEDIQTGDVSALLPASIEADLQTITAGRNLTPEQLAQESSAIAGEIIDEDDLTEVRNVVIGAGRQMLRAPGEAAGIFQAAADELTAPDGVLGEQQFDELQGELQTRYGVSEAQSAEIADRWRGEFVANRDALVATYRETYDDAANTLNEAAESAAETARAAAETASSIAWWTAIGSLLGLLAAAIGAAMARPEEELKLASATVGSGPAPRA